MAVATRKPEMVGTVWTASASLMDSSGKVIARCIDTPNAIAKALMEMPRAKMVKSLEGTHARAHWESRMKSWNVAKSGLIKLKQTWQESPRLQPSQLQGYADSITKEYGVPRIPIVVTDRHLKGQAVYNTWKRKGERQWHPKNIQVGDWDVVSTHPGEMIMRLGHELAHHIENTKGGSLAHSSRHGNLEDEVGLKLSRKWKETKATEPSKPPIESETKGGATMATETIPKGEYYIDRGTGKMELHFDKASYLALPEDLRKSIKSYFLFSRGKGAWISKGQADSYMPQEIAKKLGFQKAGEVGEKVSFAEQQERKAERAAERAERYEGYSASASKRASELAKDFNRFHGDIAFFTQPGRIPFRDKVFARYEKSFGEEKKATHFAEQAERLQKAATQAQLKSPRYLDNRIKESEAKLRSIGRYAEEIKQKGGTVPESLEERATAELDKLMFYKKAMEDLGGVKYSQANIQKGDQVLTRFGWGAVRSTGPKNMKVETGHGFALTLPYAEIKDHKGQKAPEPPKAEPKQEVKLLPRATYLPDYKVFNDETYQLTGVFEHESGAKTPDGKVVYGKDHSGNVGYGRYQLVPKRVTDPHDVQEIKNSIAEGEMILKSGRSVTGRRMSTEELGAVKRSVDTAKAKVGAKVEAPKPSPEAKEPWKMTRAEYVKSKIGHLDLSKADKAARGSWARGGTTFTAEYTEMYQRGHKNKVEAALKEGKPVPAEVLKDYPELGKKEELPSQFKILGRGPSGEANVWKAANGEIIERIQKGEKKGWYRTQVGSTEFVGKTPERALEMATEWRNKEPFKGKEGWQIPRADWMKAHLAGHKVPWPSGIAGEPTGGIGQVGDPHWAMVERALKAGKPVPKEVLGHYERNNPEWVKTVRPEPKAEGEGKEPTSKELLQEASPAELKKAADWYKAQYRLGDKSQDIKDWRTYKVKEVMNSKFNLGGRTVADFNSTRIVQAIENGLEPVGDWRSEIVGKRDGVTVYKDRPYGDQNKVSGYANQDFNFMTLFRDKVKVEKGEPICVYMPVGGFGVLHAVPASGKHQLHHFEKIIGHDEFNKLVTSKRPTRAKGAPKTESKLEAEAKAMGLSKSQIAQAKKEGVTTALGLRRIEKTTRGEAKPKKEPKALKTKPVMAQSDRALAIDRGKLAMQVVPAGDARWLTQRNRFDVRGIDTPGSGRVTSRTGFTDKRQTRMSRKHHRGWKRVKL